MVSNIITKLVSERDWAVLITAGGKAMHVAMTAVVSARARLRARCCDVLLLPKCVPAWCLCLQGPVCLCSCVCVGSYVSCCHRLQQEHCCSGGKRMPACLLTCTHPSSVIQTDPAKKSCGTCHQVCRGGGGTWRGAVRFAWQSLGETPTFPS